MNIHLQTLALSLGALAALGATFAGAAVPYPTKSTPAALDLGALEQLAGASEVSVTLSLKLQNPEAAQDLFRSIYTQSSANFHEFLSPDQFKTQFAQSDAAVADAATKLAAYGLTSTRTGASTLRVTGTPASLERAFKVSLHVYEVPAKGSARSYRFQAPINAATVPAEVSSVVDQVIGLSTRPQYIPHNIRGIAALVKPKTIQQAPSGGKGTTTNEPGLLTVADFEQYYDALPLIAKGVTGSGRTLGIVTLAAFTESDPFAYWNALGLKIANERIKVVNVDGGPGAPSDASGSIETTLDVEQSGGIAPGAKIVVYQAPNTNQAFLDAFVAAVEDNKAESVSTSWGAWEWFDNLANAPVTDPYTGETVSSLKAFDQIFLQAALQGQSLFAASGDAGAYDANDGNLPPDFSLALSVDNPASDPYITAAGGTTLAGVQTFGLQNNQTLSVDVPNERVWSWDYLVPLCDDLGQDPIDCGIFPVGSGGGVSFEWRLPSYQQGLAGIQKTQPDQSFIDEDVIPPQTLVDIPAHFAGRNVPDISANADPDTGYVIYYTSDQTGFAIDSFYGGTSFIGPQLNGVVGLIGQYAHSRIGLLNVPLYELANEPGAYSGKAAPFNVIEYGNNDFYLGRDGYSPAVGIGTPDVSNLAEALKKRF
jgi:subtilase family serine protease